MILMEEYLLYDQIADLCSRIKLSEEAITRVLPYIKNGRCLAAAPYFEGLFGRETAMCSAKSIAAIFTDNNGKYMDSGFGLMAVFLAAAMRTREIYAERGIGSDIYYHTMSCFKEVMDENFARDGYWNFERPYWIYLHISCLLHRLGTLEFEMLFLDKRTAGACGLPENEPVLSVHIQTGSVITREALDESYEMALKFFPKHYPDFRFSIFYCSTWLLAPVLKELLPAGSRILGFQSGYRIVYLDEDQDGYYARVFNMREKIADVNLLPEDTTLRRNIKRHLINGGKIGWAIGLKDI